MACPEYRDQLLILKKTKLGESDVILHAMNKQGSAVHCVAKGARKPTNANSAQLDLCNVVQATLVKGKSLNIIKNVRLVSSCPNLAAHPLYYACACVLLEALDQSIQPDLPVENLFPLACTALESLDERAVNDSDQDAVVILSAFLLKLSSFLGMQPCLTTCIFCETPLVAMTTPTYFSLEEGGLVCEECSKETPTNFFVTPGASLVCSHYLLYSRFSAISNSNFSNSDYWASLELALKWFSYHANITLKTLSSFLSISQEFHLNATRKHMI